MTLKPHETVLHCGNARAHDAHSWGFSTRCLGTPQGVITQHSNLDKAINIVDQINKVVAVQKALKGAFVHRALEGGVKAAFTHPLYLEAEAKIQELEEQLTLLI